jgi:hypothetical protein
VLFRHFSQVGIVTLCCGKERDFAGRIAVVKIFPGRLKFGRVRPTISFAEGLAGVMLGIAGNGIPRMRMKICSLTVSSYI